MLAGKDCSYVTVYKQRSQKQINGSVVRDAEPHSYEYSADAYLERDYSYGRQLSFVGILKAWCLPALQATVPKRVLEHNVD